MASVLDATQISDEIQTQPKWEEAVKDSHGQQEDVNVPSVNNVDEVLQYYGQRFGFQSEEQEPAGFNHKGGNASGETNVVKELTGMQARRELEKDLGLERGALSKDQQAKFVKRAPAVNSSSAEEDSDGEELRLCRKCKLPLGDVTYFQRDWCSGTKDSMHGECMALEMAQKAKDKEEAQKAKDKLAKKQQHEEYGIGWNVEHIPRNSEAASKLAMRDVPQGMVCLVLDEESKSIRVASTVEPAAALNLEYLSTALQVRRLEGHEPIFSLDAVDPTNKNSMQEKVFIPDWLAGTTVGEVLFQSDYHLKELSMGEHEQPVVGMKSCFALIEQEDFNDWTAREWFMVRKAEVQITDQSVLIPYVKLGVEAREQVVIDGCLEDLPVTRPDHPMVKYAEAFTQNFDLIAERKSVVYHLRELAKTSVVAKFLMDAEVDLDESWFHLQTEKEITTSLEVPQLWNKSNTSNFTMSDSGIAGQGAQHGVFGGVNFGLDKFQLSRGVARESVAAALSMSAPTRGFIKTPGLAAAITPTALALSTGTPKAGVVGLGAQVGLALPTTKAGRRPQIAGFAASLIAQAKEGRSLFSAAGPTISV